jgi:hypothetical protein
MAADAQLLGRVTYFDGAARISLKLADITRIGPDGVTIQRYTPAVA